MHAKRMVAIETIRGEMGWNSFEERIEKSFLYFKKILDFLDKGRPVKLIYKYIFSGSKRSKWEKKCSELMNTYNLEKLRLLND